jgi:hypothetical protein
MTGIVIVDESQSFFGGLYSNWSHRNVTRHRNESGKIGLSYTDLCFIGICAFLVSFSSTICFL